VNAPPGGTPFLSVILPFKDSEATIGACLDALAAQRYERFEVLPMDDASLDGAAALCRDKGFEPIRCERPFPFCRNEGARRARGDVLVYVDSDVVLPPDTLSRVAEALTDERWSAVVGTYSVEHPHPGLASQYKNLWIRYSYLARGGSIDFIFGAISAVRRTAFTDIGGFDEAFRHRTGGTDIDAGMRLIRKGHAIRLDPSIEVVHLRRYRARALLANDFWRSLGYSRLGARHRRLRSSFARGFSNISAGFIASVGLAWAATAAAVTAVATSSGWSGAGGVAPGAAAVCLGAAYLAINAGFLGYFARHRGRLAAARLVPLLFLDHLVCGVGGALGLLQGLGRRVRGASAARAAGGPIPPTLV
jgi:glycosyltransferase involved in cell wall biosynthesis